MNYELRDRLEQIAALVASGDALERDLALELLREVYSDIKYGASLGSVPVCEAGANLGTEEDAIGLRYASAPQAQELRNCTDLHPLTPLEPDCMPVSTTPEVLSEPEPELEVLPEPEPEPEPECEPEPEPAPEILPEPVPEPEPVPHVIPRPVAPEVIRSLYGSEGAETEPEPEPRPRPASKPEHKPEQKHDPEPGPKHSATLGDAIAPAKTLGETLRSGGGERDMAARIAAAQAAGRPGLKRSIGLNDRFLMIRDMFGGDADAFDRAITRLDAFTDFDEAVIWIHDNFDWSADNPGATLLVGLLQRKLGR